MITCTRMAEKHWIILYIGSHLSSTPCLSFTKTQSAWQQRQCNVCKEIWPTRSCLNSDSYTCYLCKRDKRSPKLFSTENDMNPGPVPLCTCLEGLTRVEQMLITRGCPVMCVYRKKCGQRGYKKHVLNFPQHIQGFLDSLPSYVSDLSFLVVRRMGQDNSHRDFKVRRTRVYDALVWLRDNYRFYQDIHIN